MLGARRFDVIKRDVPPGHTYYQGRKARRQTTSRPTFWPEIEAKGPPEAVWKLRKNTVDAARSSHVIVMASTADREAQSDTERLVGEPGTGGINGPSSGA